MQRHKIRLLIFLVCSKSFFAYSQQTYDLQHNQIQTEEQLNPLSTKLDADVFIGCIKFNVSYVVMPTADAERRNKAEFVASQNKKSLGDELVIPNPFQ